MICIQKLEVPLYLQGSEFYRNLSDEEGEQFDLSFDHYKSDCEISNSTDLDHLLSTLRFWGTLYYPTDLYNYLWEHDVVEYEPILHMYWNELTELKCFVNVLRTNKSHRVDAAVPFGDLVFIRYMLGRGCTFDQTACKTAAACGQLECLKYFLQHLPHQEDEVYQEIIHAAIEAKQFECLQYMVEHDHHDIEWLRCLSIATLSGSLPCLKLIFEQCGHQWCSYADFYLVRSGSVECLHFAVEHGLTYDYSVMWEAAERGLLPIVEYLHTHGLDLYENLLNKAAACGHVDIMHYVYTHVSCNVRTCVGSAAAAAGNGHLHCLLYAHKHFTTPWNASATRAAAAANQLECLTVLHTHNCPWNCKTTDAAIKHKSAECLKYAVEHGCPVRLTHKLNQLWRDFRDATKTTLA